MTSARIDRRIGMLEIRVADIEDSHAESLYKLTRHASKVDLVQDQLADGVNSLGRGMAMMMERMGLPALDFPVITVPTEDEIDTALEADC